MRGPSAFHEVREWNVKGQGEASKQTKTKKKLDHLHDDQTSMKMIPEETLISISHCQKSKFSISTQKAIPVMAEPFSFLLFLCESFGSSHRLIFRLYIINTLGSSLFFLSFLFASFMPRAHHEIATDPTQIVFTGALGRGECMRHLIYRAVPFTWIFPNWENGRATPLSFFFFFTTTPPISSSSSFLIPALHFLFRYRCHRQRARKTTAKKKNVRRRRRREYNRRHELAPPLDLFAESRNNSSKRRLVCLLAGPCPTNRPAQLSLSLDSFARVFWFALSSSSSPTTSPALFFYVWLGSITNRRGQQRERERGDK